MIAATLTVDFPQYLAFDELSMFYSFHRVRSLDLDEWPPGHIAVMTCMGNYIANCLWEARYEKELMKRL